MGPSAESKPGPGTLPAFLPIFRRSVAVSLQIVAISSFFLRVAAAQTPTPPPPTSSQVPVIAIDHMFFDFGKIRHGQMVVHGFTVSNTGKATLHIKEIHANCGCTSTVVGKMNLEPGESTEIEAEFTPDKEFSGAVRKTILVISDAPVHSTLTLRFAADVLPPAEKAAP